MKKTMKKAGMKKMSEYMKKVAKKKK